MVRITPCSKGIDGSHPKTCDGRAKGGSGRLNVPIRAKTDARWPATRVAVGHGEFSIKRSSKFATTAGRPWRGRTEIEATNSST